MLGLGIALAVLVDAFVVRLLLIPALLSLGGRAAWWAPAPLRALDRRFGVREETGGRAEPLAEGGRA
jgi:RND superfamily putative drug exporter